MASLVARPGKAAIKRAVALRRRTEAEGHTLD